MKPVNAENVLAEINRLESFVQCTTRRLLMSEEFHLNCLKHLYGVLKDSEQVIEFNFEIPNDLSRREHNFEGLTNEQRKAFIKSMADEDSKPRVRTMVDRMFGRCINDEGMTAEKEENGKDFTVHMEAVHLSHLSQLKEQFVQSMMFRGYSRDWAECLFDDQMKSNP